MMEVVTKAVNEKLKIEKAAAGKKTKKSNKP